MVSLLIGTLKWDKKNQFSLCYNIKIKITIVSLRYGFRFKRFGKLKSKWMRVWQLWSSFIAHWDIWFSTTAAWLHTLLNRRLYILLVNTKVRFNRNLNSHNFTLYTNFPQIFFPHTQTWSNDGGHPVLEKKLLKLAREFKEKFFSSYIVAAFIINLAGKINAFDKFERNKKNFFCLLEFSYCFGIKI